MSTARQVKRLHDGGGSSDPLASRTRRGIARDGSEPSEAEAAEMERTKAALRLSKDAEAWPRSKVAGVHWDGELWEARTKQPGRPGAPRRLCRLPDEADAIRTLRAFLKDNRGWEPAGPTVRPPEERTEIPATSLPLPAKAPEPGPSTRPTSPTPAGRRLPVHEPPAPPRPTEGARSGVAASPTTGVGGAAGAPAKPLAPVNRSPADVARPAVAGRNSSSAAPRDAVGVPVDGSRATQAVAPPVPAEVAAVGAVLAAVAHLPRAQRKWAIFASLAHLEQCPEPEPQRSPPR